MEGGRIVQTGTPTDIFTNPCNAYVADFVAHMNPLGVLRLRDVMRPAASTPSASLPADTLVRDSLNALMDAGGTVGVTDDRELIGESSKDDVLKGLTRATQ